MPKTVLAPSAVYSSNRSESDRVTSADASASNEQDVRLYTICARLYLHGFLLDYLPIVLMQDTTGLLLNLTVGESLKF